MVHVPCSYCAFQICIGEVLIACGNNQTTLYLTAAHGELSVTAFMEGNVHCNNFSCSCLNVVIVLARENSKL